MYGFTGQNTDTVVRSGRVNFFLNNNRTFHYSLVIAKKHLADIT